MSGVVIQGSRTYDKDTSSLGAYLRVKLTAGVLALAGASDVDIGTTERLFLAGENVASVVHPRVAGTVRMVVSAAVTAYAKVYGASNGRVSSTASGIPIGIALTAASNAGEIIEVLRLDSPESLSFSPTEAHTADDALSADESGSTHTTYGASGTVVFSLPAATVGLSFRFVVGAAQELRIDPNGTETISLPSTGVAGAAGKYLTANAAGESVELRCVQAGTWAAFAFTGTWTAEP